MFANLYNQNDIPTSIEKDTTIEIKQAVVEMILQIHYQQVLCVKKIFVTNSAFG